MNITQQAGTWDWELAENNHGSCPRLWLVTKRWDEETWAFHNHHGEPSLSTTEQVRSDNCSTRRCKVCHILFIIAHLYLLATDRRSMTLYCNWSSRFFEYLIWYSACRKTVKFLKYFKTTVFVSYFKFDFIQDFAREGQGTQSTWESSPFRSQMFHLLNEESSLLNKIRFLKRYLDILYVGNKIVFPIFNLSVEPVRRVLTFTNKVSWRSLICFWSWKYRFSIFDRLICNYLFYFLL